MSEQQKLQKNRIKDTVFFMDPDSEIIKWSRPDQDPVADCNCYRILQYLSVCLSVKEKGKGGEEEAVWTFLISRRNFIQIKFLSDTHTDNSSPENLHYQICNTNFRDIIRNVEENKILHEIFRIVSRFPRYISCSISENKINYLRKTQ